MPPNRAEDRLAQLSAARERAAARRAEKEAELEQSIRSLARLVHSVDPIRRQVFWSAETVETLAARQDWKCPQCQKRLAPLGAQQHHVDHVVPWILGGGNELSNIQILHEWCNLAKGRRCDYDMVIENLDDRIRNL